MNPSLMFIVLNLNTIACVLHAFVAQRHAIYAYMQFMHCWGSGRGLCPLVKIGPQYSLLIVKGNKKGQRTKKLYLEAVSKARQQQQPLCIHDSKNKHSGPIDC